MAPTRKEGNTNVVGVHYQVGKQIGEGSFGVVFEGINLLNTQQKVAIKFEPRRTDAPQLKDEYRSYRILSGSLGIPNAYYFGQEPLHNILVIDLLGPNLEELFDLCGRKFSVKTVAMAAQQMLTRIQAIHEKNLIHRDILPGNFLIAPLGSTNTEAIYVIDFGMAKPWRDVQTMQHIPYREHKPLTGAARYMSIHTHLGRESSRRDDLEMLGHVLLHFVRGSLPWQRLKAATNKQKYNKIGEKKQSTSIDELCDGFPEEFGVYLNYVRKLGFEETPDYDFLRDLFKTVLRNIGETDDGVFDWTLLHNSKTRGASVGDGFSEQAKDLHDATYASGLIEVTANTTSDQRDTIASTSASVPLNNDITGLVSLDGNTPIGYGGFGDLFLGVHKDRGKVALKKPRRLLDDALIRRFLREVDLWCSVSHRYVLPCLGMCKVGLDVYVVSPFIENGDLFSCMVRGKVFNRNKLLYEVAEALAHLHHRGIVHGDVKAQNILLGDDGSALLCDFGLAKAFDTMVTSTESKGAGSVRWMAPELFQDESRSMASDVYSFGITTAEVVSGHAPYPDITSNLAVMRHVADRGGRPAKEPLSSPEGVSYVTLWETAEKCWVDDPKARPHMAQVLGMLFPLTRIIT